MKLVKETAETITIETLEKDYKNIIAKTLFKYMKLSELSLIGVDDLCSLDIVNEVNNYLKSFQF